MRARGRVVVDEVTATLVRGGLHGDDDEAARHLPPPPCTC
jgi:hypothetical protein